MPFKTIIKVANIASRASVGLFSPCSMIETSMATSMVIMENVRISVP